jgi:hypothetical protein
MIINSHTLNNDQIQNIIDGVLTKQAGSRWYGPYI